MPQPEKLHYRLTTEEWLSASQSLNKAELTILYYLRTLTPWGDRHLDLKVVDIAKSCHMAKGTASKALHRLGELGWIDLEMVTVRIKLNSSVKFPTGNLVSPEKLDYPTGNQINLEETLLSSRKPNNPVGNFQDSEPAQAKDYESSHTYLNSLNYSNSSHSLERGEENFNFEPEENQKQINISRELQALQTKLSSQLPSLQVDQCSASPLVPVEKAIVEHPATKMERKFKNSRLPNWRVGREPNSINDSFAEFIRRWLSSIPPERNRSRGDAIAYIRKQENSGDLSVLEARAQEWELEQLRPKRPEQAPAYAFGGAKPYDYGEAIAEIEAQLLRLGWSKQQAIAQMIDRHNWRCSPEAALSQLADWELLELLETLEESYETASA